MATRRPGRAQRIACDESPLGASTVDVRARAGWLLAMSRLHHPDPSFGDGRAFAEALGAAGFPASRSLLSRWESGSAPVSYEAMTAYERVLALELGQLTSALDHLLGSQATGRTAGMRPRLDPGSRAFADRLDELIDAAEVDAALARDWQELGWHLTAAPMVHLRRATWASLAGHLVGRLPRAVGGAHRQLVCTAADLATVPRAQDQLVDAVAAFVSDPAVQVVAEPLGVLARVPTSAAARLVLEVLEKPQGDAIWRVGVRVATDKVRRDELTSGERAELVMLLARHWPRDAARAGTELSGLVAALPEPARAGLVAASATVGGRRIGEGAGAGEGLSPESVARYTGALAAVARLRVPQEASYEEDTMLPRLLTEALFDARPGRRHAAALLVAASPFRPAVGHELLGRLARSAGPPWLRVREAELVREVCAGAHRAELLAVADDPEDGVAVAVLEALGHVTGTSASDAALVAGLEVAWSPRGQARVQALGMTSSPALPRLLSDAATPRWQASAARWWLAQGGVVRA